MTSFEDIETESARLRKRLRAFRFLVGVGPIVAIIVPKEAEPAPAGSDAGRPEKP